MAFMVRDEAVMALDATDEDSNVLDIRAQIPFMAFGRVNAKRVDVDYDISGSKGRIG